MAGDPFCGVGWRFLDEVLVNRAVDIGTPWQGGLRGPSAAHFGLQRSLSAGRQFQPPSTTRRSASVSVPSRPASCLSGFAPVVWASPPSGRPGFGRDAFGGVVPAALAPATPNFLPVRARAELGCVQRSRPEGFFVCTPSAPPRLWSADRTGSNSASYPVSQVGRHPWRHRVETTCATYPGGVVIRFFELASALASLAESNRYYSDRIATAIERGLGKVTAETFLEHDQNRKGYLTWNGNEIRDFVNQIFRQYGLAAPTEMQTFLMYSRFDAKRAMCLTEFYCRNLVDALFRAILALQDAKGQTMPRGSPVGEHALGCEALHCESRAFAKNDVTESSPRFYGSMLAPSTKTELPRRTRRVRSLSPHKFSRLRLESTSSESPVDLDSSERVTIAQFLSRTRSRSRGTQEPDSGLVGTAQVPCSSTDGSERFQRSHQADHGARSQAVAREDGAACSTAASDVRRVNSIDERDEDSEVTHVATVLIGSRWHERAHPKGVSPGCKRHVLGPSVHSSCVRQPNFGPDHDVNDGTSDTFTSSPADKQLISEIADALRSEQRRTDHGVDGVRTMEKVVRENFAKSRDAARRPLHEIARRSTSSPALSSGHAETRERRPNWRGPTVCTLVPRSGCETPTEPSSPTSPARGSEALRCGMTLAARVRHRQRALRQALKSDRILQTSLHTRARRGVPSNEEPTCAAGGGDPLDDESELAIEASAPRPDKPASRSSEAEGSVQSSRCSCNKRNEENAGSVSDTVENLSLQRDQYGKHAKKNRSASSGDEPESEVTSHVLPHAPARALDSDGSSSSVCMAGLNDPGALHTSRSSSVVQSATRINLEKQVEIEVAPARALDSDESSSSDSMAALNDPAGFHTSRSSSAVQSATRSHLDQKEGLEVPSARAMDSDESFSSDSTEHLAHKAGLGNSRTFSGILSATQSHVEHTKSGSSDESKSEGEDESESEEEDESEAESESQVSRDSSSLSRA